MRAMVSQWNRMLSMWRYRMMRYRMILYQPSSDYRMMSQPMLRRCRMELAASVVVFPELRVSPQAAHLCRHLGMRGSSQLRYLVINGSVAEHHGVFLLQFILVCPACICQCLLQCPMPMGGSRLR